MDETYVQIGLPSKCVIYEGVNPADIRIRPFKGKEEELIAGFAPENIKKKFLAVLESVLKGVDVSKLTSGDVKHIMLWEAISSFTSSYPIELICEGCGLKISVDVDLNTIDVKELPADFKQPVAVELSDGRVNLRLQTIQDEISTVKFELAGHSPYLHGYALCIVDSDKDVLDRIKMLEEMSTQDLTKIIKFHAKYDHGPDMNVEYECPKCDQKGRVMLPFRFDVLLSASARS